MCYINLLAHQLRLWTSLSAEEKEMISSEESTVYSQAIHYSNRMVYMRVPLDATKSLREPIGIESESNSTSSNITSRYGVLYR